jgi:hypothetical protein
MDMNQAATFLGSSILLMMGIVVLVIGVVVINNILNRYWKPVRIFTPDSWKGFHPPIYHNEQVRVEPPLKDSNEHTTNK